MIAVVIIATTSGTFIRPEARRRIYWTNVSIHTKVWVGHLGAEWCILISQRGAARYPRGYAMKKITAPSPFAGSRLNQMRHVCVFFNRTDEEYRALLPFMKDGFRCGNKMPPCRTSSVASLLRCFTGVYRRFDTRFGALFCVEVKP